MKPPPKSIARRTKPQGKRRSQLPASPREAATLAVLRHVDRFPDLLPAEPRTDALDARDAALAHALYDASVRRWRTLTFLLNTRLRRPMHTLQPGLQAALLVGAAQLLLMDRIPDHAAINEAVEWVKRNVRPGAAKMANAVLRAVAAIRADKLDAFDPDRRDAIPLGDGARTLTEPLFPEDPIERIALQAGLTPWLVGRWASALGLDETRRQGVHSVRHAPVIVNVAHAADLGALADWPDHTRAGFKIAPPGADIAAAIGDRTDLWVQDPSSAAPVASLPDLNPSRIIDVCAGQGTKTRQLMRRFPNASVIASDVDDQRMASLRELAKTHPTLDVCPAPDLAYEHAGKADLVLLDVPCTNTGVLARRVEARHRCSQRQLDRLLDTQRQIIADAIRLLAPGAAILYATCSLEPEECDDQAAWTGKWHNLEPSRRGAILPTSTSDPADYADGARWVLLGGPAGAGRTR